MNNLYMRFLQALEAALQDRSVDWTDAMSEAEWMELFQLATRHKVLPMVFEAVVDCSAGKQLGSPMFVKERQNVMQQVAMQTMRTEEFLKLYQVLLDDGTHPVVLKGWVNRILYPKPDLRMSADEDLWVDRQTFWQCHQRLLEYGMEPSRELPDQEEMAVKKVLEMGEVTYRKRNSPLSIELHMSLFSSEEVAYGSWNAYFFHVLEQKAQRTYHMADAAKDGCYVWSMKETDYFFYLVCHALKHFIHGGVGIRQICDILQYAKVYGTQIQWDTIWRQCEEINGTRFVLAILNIGEKYLGFSWDEMETQTEIKWSQKRDAVDEMPLLQDVLEAGIYGDSSMSRKHSSTITLEAVRQNQRKAGTPSKGKMARKKRHVHLVWKAVFPSPKEMTLNDPYLEKRPYLLPVVWMRRIFSYMKETRQTAGMREAAKSVQMGTSRIALLEQYHIIDQ